MFMSAHRRPPGSGHITKKTWEANGEEMTYDKCKDCGLLIKPDQKIKLCVTCGLRRFNSVFDESKKDASKAIKKARTAEKKAKKKK